jgi:hypothetical protein
MKIVLNSALFVVISTSLHLRIGDIWPMIWFALLHLFWISLLILLFSEKMLPKYVKSFVCFIWFSHMLIVLSSLAKVLSCVGLIGDSSFS